MPNKVEYYAMLDAIAGQWVSHYAGDGRTRISFRRQAVRPWFVVLAETVGDREAWRSLVRRQRERREMIDRIAEQYSSMRPDGMPDGVWKGVVAASLKGMTYGVSSGV